MPLDAYSPCPGGTGKKIKFCCSDLLPELQKIARMLDGGQLQSALALVERLSQTHPGRACLLSLTCVLSRATDRDDQAAEVSRAFLAAHPQNPAALAEAALTAAETEPPKEYVGLLLRAVAASTAEVHPRVYQVLESLVSLLVAEGHYLAARAMVGLQMRLVPDDQRAGQVATHLLTAAEIPVWVRDEGRLPVVAEETPWAKKFAAALAPAAKAQWPEAAGRLEALAAEVGDQLAIRRAVAMLRAWSGDNEAAAAAYRRYAAMNVPLEDAAEAEALALFLDGDPFGDARDVLAITFEAPEPEQVEHALRSSPRAVEYQGDLAAVDAPDGIRPQAMWNLFSAAPADGAPLDPQTTPYWIASAGLFGRQTDRPARLELRGVFADDEAPLETFLRDLAGGALGPVASRETTDRRSALTHQLMRRWQIRTTADAEALDAFLDRHIQRLFFEVWPDRPTPTLGGLSPRAAAADPKLRVKVLAAILFLESLVTRLRWKDLSALRGALGLPTLGPIEADRAALESLPAGRLPRVVVEPLSDDELLMGYRRAAAMGVSEALLRFARPLLARESFRAHPSRLAVLATAARLEEDPQQALGYLQECRQARGEACSQWDLLEVEVRMRGHEADQISRLLRHLYEAHHREPETMQALQQIMYSLGLVDAYGRPTAAPAPPEPGIVVPGAPGEEPGKLWTPESERPAGQKSGLWIPGAE